MSETRFVIERHRASGFVPEYVADSFVEAVDCLQKDGHQITKMETIKPEREEDDPNQWIVWIYIKGTYWDMRITEVPVWTHTMRAK